ncbi:mechanosensitive ion channel family protein [Candidatus Saccharibacteria bacterium]|nr:mechanosensitive ion channel family protein [Candidatus Saccharibacteria bacterium]
MIESILNGTNESAQRILDGLTQWVSQHGFNVIVILIFAWFLRRFGTKLSKRIITHSVRLKSYPTKADRDKRIKTLQGLSSAFIRFTVYFVTIFMVVGQINPAYTTALFASAGLVTVALGFGAQSLVRDLVSGMFIVSENQYRIGDEVELQSGVWNKSQSGRVESISLRVTTLRDLDGNLHHVPNGSIGYTTNKTIGFSRINEDITVAFGTNIDKLAEIVEKVGKQMVESPEWTGKITQAPFLDSVRKFDKDGIVVKILGRTTPADQWNIRADLYKRLIDQFAKHKILLAGQKPSNPLKNNKLGHK